MNAEEIFQRAVEIPTIAERDVFVSEICGTDGLLRAKVEGLLKSHDEAGSFLDQSLFILKPTIELRSNAEGPGTVIGPYKLLEKLGEGGMGTVWIAEREQPKQRVALKLIKPGMDSKQIIRRFDAERQALALMSHNNIAKMLDAGTTESGRPYFVMELVKGVPITKYCDETHASVQERLKLFIPVCLAVQHAHQKGIIHRDIKPSNVLVCIEDGKPVPKVIDFGVAKALHQPLTEGTLHTAFNQIVGTLEYMSPEQAELNALDIDTRADIYALGVLLFELLTGSTPITRDELKQVAIVGMLRKIKEIEPRKPSTRLSESKETIASLAALRRTDPSKLMKEVRGDLDWIVLKCLESDRTRRYETANALAREVERHLADEAVEARAPTAAYRFSKFVRRNKGPVLASSMVFLSLIVGMIGTSWQAWVADQNRQTAETNQQQALKAAEEETKAKLAAQQREAEVEAVLDFVAKKIFVAARPATYGGLGNQVSLRKAIDYALPYIEKSLKDKPLIEARIRYVLGRSYEDLGDFKEAVRQLELVRDIYTRHDGPDADKTLGCMDDLATVYRLVGKHTEAFDLHQQTLQLLTAKYGPNDIRTLGCMVNLSTDYMITGKAEEGLRLAEKAQSVLQTKFQDHEFTFNCRINVARCYQTLLQPQKALQLNEELLAQSTGRFGSDNNKTILIMMALARTHLELGNYSKAVELGEKVVEKVQSDLVANHPLALEVVTVLADSYSVLGKYQDALKYDQKSLEVTKAMFGADDRATFQRMNAVADDYYRLNRLDDSARLHRTTLERRRQTLGPEDMATLESMNNLANVYGEFGQHAEALKLYQEALAVRQKKGVNDKETLAWMCNIARTYPELGRHAEAVALFEKTLALMKSQLGPTHPYTLQCLENYAAVLSNSPEVSLRDPSRALALMQERLAAKSNAGIDYTALGVAQYRMGDWQSASTSLMKSIQLSQGGDSYDWFFLAMTNWRLGHQQEARNWYEKAVQWMEKNKPKNTALLRLRAESFALLQQGEAKVK